MSDRSDRFRTTGSIGVERASELGILSPAFEHGAEIPVRYTCDGDDVSPPLVFRRVPDGTRALALIVKDPDAPDPLAPERTLIHWVLYDLPPSTGELAEAVSVLPRGTHEGLNDWKRCGYRGPCPAVGRHRYFYELTALAEPVGYLGTPTARQLEVAMRAHVLSRASLMGTYIRKPRPPWSSLHGDPDSRIPFGGALP